MESAGTSLKTVIGRFGEVKKLISQGETTGTDEEGTEIDVNKIETALRAANVALRDTEGQMRDLDDVFLDLSRNWDGLDTMTQRWIATEAAGSRQQSRFLAMISNYDELMKTVSYAQNAEGASEEQFVKTLDSLQSKLNNLSNAWTEFTTGIANSTVIKGSVDVLTKLLGVINDLTGSMGDFGGTASKALLMFGGLRYGTGAMGSILSLLGINTATPTLKDQWNTGLGSVFSAFNAVQGLQKVPEDVLSTYTQLSSGKWINATGEDVEIISRLGQAFVRVGESASGAKGAISVFWGALSAPAKVSLVIAGLTAVVGIIQLIASAIKTAKERAEEFQQQIQDLSGLSQELNDLESTLKDYQSYNEGIKDKSGAVVEQDFTTLVKGVGTYGQNLTLTTDEYDRYLEICDAIVAKNPKLAEGYNSNAEAIANNKTALEELIAVQKEQIQQQGKQISAQMDTEFFKNVKGQAETYQNQKDEANQDQLQLRARLLAETWRTAGLSAQEFDLVGRAIDVNTVSLWNLIQNYEDYEGKVREQIKDEDKQEKALQALRTYQSYYNNELESYEARIDSANQGIEEQKDTIKDLYISMLPGVDGWTELSEAQQSFIEQSIRNKDVDIFNAGAMSRQKQEIKNSVKEMQETLKIEIPVSFGEGQSTNYTFGDIIEELGSGAFDQLGANAGLEWLKGFYQAILQYGNENVNAQQAIMNLFGFDGDWEAFGALRAGGFARQVEGDNYTKTLNDINRFSTIRTEEVWGTDKKAPDYEAEYSQWQNFLRAQNGETLDIILNHWEELGQYLNAEEGPLSMSNALKAVERYNQAVQNTQSIIQRGVDAGLDEDEMNTYIDYLQKVGDEQLKINRALAAQVALESMLYDKGVKSIEDNMSNWTSAYDNKEYNRNEWAQAESQAREALANLQGMDVSDLPDNLEITKEILEDMEKAAKKDTAAMGRLAKAVTKAKLDKLNDTLGDVEVHIDTEKASDAIESFYDQFGDKLLEIPIGTDITADGLEEVESGLKTAIESGLTDGMTSDQITGMAQTMAEQAGFQDVGWELKTVTEEEAQNYSGFSIPVTTTGPDGKPISGTYSSPGGTSTGTTTRTILVPKGGDLKYTGGGGAKKPSGGGGGGGGGKEPAKPKQDPFYNYIKTVDDYKNHLEKLQDVQELLTEPFDIHKNTQNQEQYFKQLLGSNQSYLNHVNSELERLQKEAQDKYSKYIEVSIDGSLRLTEEYWKSTGDITEELDEWIDAYDDVLGRQTDLTGEILDYKKELKDLWDGWRDGYVDLTNELADIYQEWDEKQLEEKEKYYEKLEEADQRYLESVRQNIEEERNARDRANSFEELAQKQSRLALLQRDTSGRYANDIVELQKEIQDQQQELADASVDDILDKLELQLDADAERHSDLLDKMQEQIDQNVETRAYIERAEQTIAKGEEAILAVIARGEDYSQASNAERQQIEEEQKQNIANSMSYIEKLEAGITTSSEYITSMVEDSLTKQTDEVTWAIGNIPDSVADRIDNKMRTTMPEILKEAFDSRSKTGVEGGGRKFDLGEGNKYASGGLVNYTGPAWVDGTPGKPEAFLNANQTAMMAKFLETLERLGASNMSLAGLGDFAGGNCEINIDIGNLGTDYDIDQAILKVKQEIVNSSQFRNITVLSRKR